MNTRIRLSYVTTGARALVFVSPNESVRDVLNSVGIRYPRLMGADLVGDWQVPPEGRPALELTYRVYLLDLGMISVKARCYPGDHDLVRQAAHEFKATAIGAAQVGTPGPWQEAVYGSAAVWNPLVREANDRRLWAVSQ